MAWITSRHAIVAALQRGAQGTLYLQRKDSRVFEIAGIAEQSSGIDVRYVSSEKLRRIAGASVRGAALDLSNDPDRREESGQRRDQRTVELASWIEKHRSALPSPVIALDHITDPHNLGAILRSVHWFGAPLVVVPARRSATGGDVVARSSAGAVSYTTVTFVPNLRGALEALKSAGYWTYAADGCGIDLRQVAFNPPSVLILGAEGKGISPGLSRVIDQTVSIPRAKDAPASTIDSLNVSVSAGVLLYEFRRRISG